MIPFAFSHSDLFKKGLGVVPAQTFFFGKPTTVNPAPFGRPLLRIFFGNLINCTSFSCATANTMNTLLIIIIDSKILPSLLLLLLLLLSLLRVLLSKSSTL